MAVRANGTVLYIQYGCMLSCVCVSLTSAAIVSTCQERLAKLEHPMASFFTIIHRFRPALLFRRPLSII